ncbi:MAG: hypothetical protein K0S68_285 [Candidatus Saccharibacteria bacterium]|jgi:hypothetical protein|nr:hypothetical protein [Candidatus Saccharibacteria bacterium]
MAHTSYRELAGRAAAASVKVKVGQLYHHWRDPETRYKVLNIAINEADEQILVVYELQADKPVVWVRPLRGPDGWLTPVEHQGREIPRFVKVSA